MAPALDANLERLSDLLAASNQAEVGRRIGREKWFVHRLRRGRPLYDLNLIPSLARVLHVDESYLRRVVANDILRARIERRKGRAA